MEVVAKFPYFEVEFNKEGTMNDEGAAIQVLDFLAQATITDLFVISHGWNNDMDEARSLYRNVFACIREVIESGKVLNLNARKFSILGVLWPSKKFAEKELIPSAAASAGSVVTESFIQEQLEDLKGVFDNPNSNAILAEAKLLVTQLETSPDARRQFADLIRSLPDRGETHPEDGTDRFFKLSGDTLMQQLSKPAFAAPPALHRAGGAAAIGSLSGLTAHGGAAGIGQFFTGINSAARNLLNFTTYYQMKERAGVVGRLGLNQVLRRIRNRVPNLKIHLIGHSFGGRLVTSAANGPDDQPPVKPNSMTLLQAAFSHNGFARLFDNKSDGFFRKLVTENKVSGPILITFTVNDKAVGVAYPLASLIAGQNASGLGDANDPYGGIGRNGAQHTPEAVSTTPLGSVGSTYSFQAGKLYNLNADAFITSHSDIAKVEVAYALLTAVAAT